MEFRVLGPVELWDGDRRVDTGTAKQRAVLAALLWDLGRSTTLDTLVERVWGEDAPSRAPASVYAYVTRLRGLGLTISRDDRGGYRLDVPADAVDVHRFRGAAGLSCQHALREALDLWRGEPFGDLSGEWIEEVREDLARQRVQAAVAWAGAALGNGHHAAVLAEVTALLRSCAFDESLIELRLRALELDGRQAEALAYYAQVRARLSDELGAEPGTALRAAHARLLRAPVAWRGPRGGPDRLIGRDTELSELVGLLDTTRLVTVTGPGGCGKTSVALAAAESVSARFPDGVVVLALASLTDEDEVIGALCAVLGIRPEADPRAAVDHALAGQRCLLVADNCEHLDVAPLIGALAARCRGVAVLATSRQPLGLADETVWRLRPLPAEPAATLFLTRAHQAVPSWSPSPEDLEHVAEMCRLLDGLPLALELAAARIRSFAPSELVGRLRDRLDLLFRTGSDEHRHHALTETIAWSYRLLPEPEQRLLARLAVFRGGFDLDAAEVVCGFDPLTPAGVAPVLAALVDRSLVQPHDLDGRRRYRLLETVRVFAGGLVDSDEVGLRHLEHRLAQARSIDGFAQRDQLTAIAQLGPEVANLRSCLDFGFDRGHGVAAAELTALTHQSWMTHRPHLLVDRGWLVRGLAEPDVPATVRALLKYQRCLVMAMAGDVVTDADVIRTVIGELAAERPREHLEAMAHLLTNRCALLDPSVLDGLPEIVVRACESTREEVLTVLSVAGVVLNTWGCAAEARELCEEYERRTWGLFGRPPSPTQCALRVEVAVRLGELDRAAELADDLLRRLDERRSAGEQDAPRRAIAVAYLATGRPELAHSFLTNVLRTADRSFGTRWIYLRVLAAEAARRRGDHEAALRSLHEALWTDSSCVRFTFPGVLAAALLAADLGDRDTAGRFTDEWRRISAIAGLPVPLGFVVESPGAAGEPVWPWAEIRRVAGDARAWCARVLHSG